VVSTTGEGLETRWTIRSHELPADEPPDEGGADAGPSPVETMLGALAACTTITARMYADRKGWPMESATARVRRAAPAGPGPVDEIELAISIEGAELTDEQRERIRTIASRCPVHRTLEEGTTIRVVEAGGGG